MTEEEAVTTVITVVNYVSVETKTTCLNTEAEQLEASYLCDSVGHASRRCIKPFLLERFQSVRAEV